MCWLVPADGPRLPGWRVSVAVRLGDLMPARRSTRFALPAALAALVLGAAPALTVAPAHAAAPAKSWVSVSGPSAFSPNGDGRQDTAKFTIKVKKRANVTVRVVRNGKVVRGPVKLGKRKAGAKFSWTWNGKDSKGRRVADAVADGRKGYEVKVVARALKKQKRTSLQKVAARRAVAVDTDAGLRKAARLVADSKTVYPSTTVVHDRIKFRVTDAYALGQATLVIRNTEGRVLREIDSESWGTYYDHHPVSWDGRGADGRPLNLGRWNHHVSSGDVTARLRVSDEVGNVAETPPLTIHVSPDVLRLQTAEVTVAARDTRWSAAAWDCGPGTGNGCPDQLPCGTVVPSTLASLPGGLSYRTQACPPQPSLPRETTAVGRHWLDLPADAVRGGAAVSVTMRGRPTVDGESDTARITVAGVSAMSDPASGPTTTTVTRGFDIAQDELYSADGGFESPQWRVETLGDDSYDVGEFTVTYAYLVPTRGW